MGSQNDFFMRKQSMYKKNFKQQFKSKIIAVAIAGMFSGGAWAAAIPVPEGRYAYAFVIDGRTWVPDPKAPLAPDDGFGLEVQLVHPTGVNELYLGRVKGPRIDLSTDAVLRSSNAKEYSAATRMYGLVENDLLWAWDVAALGQELRTHASGRLARVG